MGAVLLKACGRAHSKLTGTSTAQLVASWVTHQKMSSIHSSCNTFHTQLPA